MKFLYIALLLMLSSLAQAAPEVVGQVILSFGQNVAVSEDGAERVLKRKTDIFAQDLLRTGSKGRLQVRFTDGSRLALKPGTEFKITEYQFQQANPDEGKAIYKLLKGGMRTISGQIGKVDREDYQLDAVVATIGIRGTDFSVDKEGDRLTGSVSDGRINIAAKSGESRDITVGRSFSMVGESGSISVFKTPESTDSAPSSDQASEENSEDTSEGTSESSDETNNANNNAQTETTSETSEPTAITAETSSDSSLSLETSPVVNGNSDSGTVPASDPGSEGNQTIVIAAPDPTGQGMAAPQGAMVAVAFSENRDGRARGGSGVVKADNVSAITVDNTAMSGDQLTGILYVDENPNGTSNTPCAPCSFTGGSDTTSIINKGQAAIGGANVTWGRWNADFVVVENGVTQQTIGSFHFMYSDSVTNSEQIAQQAAIRSGQFLYTFAASGKLTDPESENGATGTLTGFTGTSSSNYQGTYVVLNWDSLTIDKVNIQGSTGTGGETRNFTLTQETNASTGTAVQTSLDSLLQGGSVKLVGSCTGDLCGGAPGTDLSGNMTFDLVGNAADGAITSFGADGKNDSNQDVTFTGTMLLEDGGQVVP